jgi:hypothetical protein
MKKFWLICLFLSFLFLPLPIQASTNPTPDDLPQPISVLSSTASQLVLDFEMPEFNTQSVVMDDEQTYTMFLAPGAGSSYESKPDIPVYSAWILVPNGTTASLVVDPGANDVQGNIILNPVQTSQADLDDTSIPAFIKDELTYGTDANYPGLLAELEHQGLMHGQQVALLKIYPVQNNPISERLTIYYNMVITINFDTDSAASKKIQPAIWINPPLILSLSPKTWTALIIKSSTAISLSMPMKCLKRNRRLLPTMRI